MYNYIFNWYDGHEESSSIVLISEQKYSQEEFNALIESLLVEIFEEERIQCIESAKLYSEKFPDNAYEVFEEEAYATFSPYNLFWQIIEVLKTKHDFRENEYQANFSIVGYSWENVDSTIDYKNTMDKGGFELNIPSSALSLRYWKKK